jgi:hypothetical protein
MSIERQEQDLRDRALLKAFGFTLDMNIPCPEEPQ